MGLKIGGYLFSGPFDIEKAVIRKHQKPVIFVIISREGQPWDPEFRIVDIDASGPEGINFANEPRREGWDSGTISDIATLLPAYRRMFRQACPLPPGQHRMARSR